MSLHRLVYDTRDPEADDSDLIQFIPGGCHTTVFLIRLSADWRLLAITTTPEPPDSRELLSRVREWAADVQAASRWRWRYSVPTPEAEGEVEPVQYLVGQFNFKLDDGSAALMLIAVRITTALPCHLSQSPASAASNARSRP